MAERSFRLEDEGRDGPVSTLDWTLENFKAIEHASIPLERLVALTGPNSSGKSSVIQSLLLVAQSSMDDISLNGPLCRLGDPRDVIRAGTDELRFTLTTQIRETRRRPRKKEWSIELALVASGHDLKVREINIAIDGEQALSASSRRVAAATLASISPERLFSDEEVLRVHEVGGRKAPAHTFLTMAGIIPRSLVYRQRKEHVLAALRRQFPHAAIKDDPDLALQLYEELVPWLRANSDGESEGLGSAIRGLVGHGQSLTKLASVKELDGLFQAMAQSLADEGWQRTPLVPYASGYRIGYTSGPFYMLEPHRRVLEAAAGARDGIRHLRDSIRYLGPLREEPQVVSVPGGRSRTLPVGPKGEYTAELLARSRNAKVVFFDWEKRRKTLTLPAAVSLWTSYLGLGDAVAVHDQGKLGRGLRLSVNGIERDLTMVGVGASQLLPVITLILAAEPGSLVCLEQPELHLHPAVQSRLADFFLWARPDLSLIVETHSEYMINRVRRRAAEGRALPADVCVLFAEQVNSVTSLRRIRLGELGELSEWPSGFFDTADEEARALVRAVHASYEK